MLERFSKLGSVLNKTEQKGIIGGLVLDGCLTSPRNPGCNPHPHPISCISDGLPETNCQSGQLCVNGICIGNVD